MKETFATQPESKKSDISSMLAGLLRDEGNHSTSVETVNRSFQPGIFLREIDGTVVSRFGHGEAVLNSHLRSRLVQFWFGTNRAIHYEVWIHERIAQIELGLHFEASASRNRKMYGRFEHELLAIQAVLGSTIWLEEWERGWSRIYETQPLWPLDSARVATIANRMAEMITVFQPIIDA